MEHNTLLEQAGGVTFASPSTPMKFALVCPDFHWLVDLDSEVVALHCLVSSSVRREGQNAVAHPVRAPNKFKDIGARRRNVYLTLEQRSAFLRHGSS